MMKVALITGAARRIGAALVKKLHKANYNVVIHYHQSEEDAQILAQELESIRPESVLLIKQNLQNIDDAKLLIEKTIYWQNRLDLLINNASGFLRTDLSSKPHDLHISQREKIAEDWEILFDLNLKIPFFLSLSAYSSLAKNKGCIVNLTDIHADKPLKGYAVYCQTKAALSMQTKALAREFAPDVRVNAIAPGAIAWPENENKLSPEMKEAIIEKTPLKQHGDPDFVAQAVLSLAENFFITGQILCVDGGRSIM